MKRETQHTETWDPAKAVLRGKFTSIKFTLRKKDDLK